MKKSDFFLSISYNKSFMTNTESKLKIWDQKRISKNSIPFQKGYKPQFTDQVFEISAIATKNLLHTSSKMSKKKKI